MAYIIAMWCDGACRNNGGYDRTRPVVAGAGVYFPRGKRALRRQYLTVPTNINQGNLTATNNRAELHGLILALQTALKVIEDLHSRPYVRVYINLDSTYVVEAMMNWRFKWEQNGWQNARGLPVANRDLFEKAIELEEEIESHPGRVTYHHVYREENEEADTLANIGCDKAFEIWQRRSRLYC